MSMRVGNFEKVSLDQFKEGVKRFTEDRLWTQVTSKLSDEEIEKYYNELKLPDRSTAGSAGYDFYFPFEKFNLQPKETIVFPTGIKVNIIGDYFLGIFPKSGLSFDYKVRLDDTVAIVDADYVQAPNEGHIYLKLTNENKHKVCMIHQNMKIVQGIFIPFALTYDDTVVTRRTGGMGHSDSTVELSSTV